MQWHPGWVPTSKEEFDHQHDNVISQDTWIIDGFASWSSIERRFAAADTIIFVDYAIWIHYWWSIKRQFLSLFRPRPDFVPGCPMLPMTGKLIKMIWQIHKKYRPQLIKLVNSYQDSTGIYHIHSPSELSQLIKQYC